VLLPISLVVVSLAKLKPRSGVLSIVCVIAGPRGPRSGHLLTIYAYQRHEVTAARPSEIRNYASYREDTATRLERGSVPGVSITATHI